jgi:alkanesulfonate monooxygenase SsuD/methylene tetrahydromethanopterin reductase-like flavin-dependent oxidoreductase (luciferase family)
LATVFNCSIRRRCPNPGNIQARQSFSAGLVSGARPRWRPSSPTNSISRPAAVAHRWSIIEANSKAKTSRRRCTGCGPAAEAIGRNPAEIIFSITALIGVGQTRDQVAAALDPDNFDSQTCDGTTSSGSPTQIVDQLGSYVKLGISRVYVRTPTRMESLAGNFEMFAAEVLPQLAAINGP